MRPEVVIPVMEPSWAAAPPLKDAIWALLKKVVGHLGMIASEMKRIGDKVHEVKEDRRMRKRLQVGVQTEAHEVTEVGVGEEEEEKGKETGRRRWRQGWRRRWGYGRVGSSK